MSQSRHRALPTSTESNDEVIGWGVLLANLWGRVVLGVLAGLLIWTVLPMFLGWHTTMVMSGSMAPALQTGDALIAQPATPADVKPGQVLVVDDPDHPGRLRAHRLQAINDDGTLVLRGDANKTADSTAVQPEHLRGLGRLRIPFVALPGVWLRTGHHGYALGSVLFLGLALVAAVAGSGPGRKAAVTDGKRVRGRTTARRRAPRRARRRTLPGGLAWGAPATSLVVALTLTVVVVGAGSVTPAYAKFTKVTANPTSSWTASSSFCSAPGTVAVIPSADAAMYESGANNNYGGAPQLRIGSVSPSRNMRSLVDFTLPAVPSHCAVTQATLSFAVLTSEGPRTLTATRVDAKWDEMGVTWATQPNALGGAATASVTNTSTAVNFSVTNQVLAMYSGSSFGFVVADSVEGANPSATQVFPSRETDSPPTLTLTFG